MLSFTEFSLVAKLFFFSPLPLKNLTTVLILSLWALPKKEIDQFWLSGHSCQAHLL